VHAEADVHDTAVNSGLPRVPLGLGVGWMAQDVPFQRSASVTLPLLVRENPTAVQARADVHDTARKPPDGAVAEAAAAAGVIAIIGAAPRATAAKTAAYLPARHPQPKPLKANIYES
jgi:hypothetical protein